MASVQDSHPVVHQRVAAFAWQTQRREIAEQAVGVATDDETELGEALGQQLVLIQPEVAQQHDMLDPFALDLPQHFSEGVGDRVETGVGIRVGDGSHLGEGDAEQRKGNPVDHPTMPGLMGVVEVGNIPQPEGCVGRLLTVVQIGGQHRKIELAQELHQRAVAQIELVVAEHHGIGGQHGEQVGVGAPFEAVEIERALKGVATVQKQKTLAGCCGLGTQLGQSGQDPGITAALGAPLTFTDRGEAHWRAIEVGVAITEMGKLNRNTHLGPP